MTRKKVNGLPTNLTEFGKNTLVKAMSMDSAIHLSTNAVSYLSAGSRKLPHLGNPEVRSNQAIRLGSLGY